MRFSEKYLEDIIFEQLQSENGCAKLTSKGVNILHRPEGYLFRQLNLGYYGVADIVRAYFIGSWIYIDIIELKVTDFHFDHLIQIGKYNMGIKEIISRYDPNFLKRCQFRHVLIVSDFEESKGNIWVTGILQDFEIYTTDYSLDGIEFCSVLPINMDLVPAPELESYIDVNKARKTFFACFRNIIQKQVDW